MLWRLKSLHFKLLSLMPGGKAFHLFTQEQVTRSTEANYYRINQKVEVGLRYWKWLEQNGRANTFTNGTILDYGAGWHPTIPLLWYCFGADQQMLLDIHPNMDTPKVADTVNYLHQIISASDWVGKSFCKRQLPATPLYTDQLSDTLKSFGMDYAAPYEDTLQKKPNTLDSILCTQVLQHIEKSEMQRVFSEFFRSLKSGGLLMGTAHLVGQFRSPGLRAGQYAHLQPSPWVWENIYNSSLMSFNRLKGPDYRQLLEQAGFRILTFEVEAPNADDLAELKRIKLHPCFRHLTAEDLAAKLVFFIAEKP